MRGWARLLLALALLLATVEAQAQRRVALIIGNGKYTNAGELENPPRDAAAIEQLFKSAGFDAVQRHTDLGDRDLRRAVRDFHEETKDADIAVVFFAGHGIEVGGENYLLPVDAILKRDIDVKDEALDLSRVVELLAPAKRLRLVILDACRDNPFAKTMRRSARTTSVTGLGKVESLPADTMIAYAAKAGTTALDGDGGNSPYTTALLKHLARPGIDVRIALGNVRDEVLRTTRKQEPFVYGSLGGSEIALVTRNAASTLTGAVSSVAGVWAHVKDSASVDALNEFVERYKSDSIYVALARERIEALKRQQQAPPPSSAEIERIVADVLRKRAEAERRSQAEAPHPRAPEPSLGKATEINSEIAKQKAATGKLEPGPTLNSPKVLRVFYGTSRAPEGGEGARRFGASRGASTTFGFADVSIPREHRLGNTERPTIWRGEFSEDPQKHIVVRDVHSHDQRSFREGLADHARHVAPRVLLYVHSFNTSFLDALRSAAQMKYDLAFFAPVVVYSWPSIGGTFGYAADAAAADWSQRDFEAFVSDLLQNDALSEVAVLAVGMGARTAAGALARVIQQSRPEQVAKLRDLVLAAPDIDRDVFTREFLPLFKGKVTLTIYASSRDRVLEASRLFHKTPRLGSLMAGEAPDAALFRGLDLVDASNADTSLAGNGIYADNKSIMSDLFYLLHERLPPQRRVTLRPVASPSGQYWQLAQ